MSTMTEKPSTAQIVSAIRFSEESQPFEHLIDSGLLYWINTHALLLQGFELVLDLDAEGKATGFRLEGNGYEPVKSSEKLVGLKERWAREVMMPQFPPVGHVR